MSRLQMVAVLFILLASLLATVGGKTSVRYEEEAAWDQDWSDEATGETTTACPWHSDWGIGALALAFSSLSALASSCQRLAT